VSCGDRIDSSGSLAILNAIRRASSPVSKLDSSINEVFSAGEVRGDQLLI
jgi:hypothetical protein